jgi:hypothetical protein
VSSSWRNGHATLRRGLCEALARRGPEGAFFERDLPYCAASCDLRQLPGGTPRPYADGESLREESKPAKLVQGGESGSERRWLWISGGHPAW